MWKIGRFRRVAPASGFAVVVSGSMRGGIAMTVSKVIELSSSSSKGIEDAVQTGLAKVSKTVKNIKSAWVNEIRAITGEDGSVIEWRVNMRINFIVD
jgi:flavin-binding protein dodecin